ncbi:MAG: 5-formyltetrahydrofolate cyclo-ligase [Lachnospiraceae bacterium]|nr:5-formyltetrahydrofolate cyclo-ligase [Lachnospiraceae bacterium]
MDILSQKKELRKEAKLYRKSLSEKDRLDKSSTIMGNLKALKEFQKAEVILMYASLPDEVETLSLIDELLQEGKKDVYCPVTQDDEMDFYKISSVDDLKEGNFHVLEPEPLEEKVLELQKDVAYCMLMPGLMFDKTGNRLGYGKGYYDKYLARVTENVSLTTIALSYEAMVKDKIPAEDTDWCANYVVTEKRFYNKYFRRSEYNE